MSAVSPCSSPDSWSSARAAASPARPSPGSAPSGSPGAPAAGAHVSSHAAGLFLLLWALFALSLTLGATDGGLLGRGTYGLLFLALLLLGVGQFAGSGSLAKAGGWFAAASGLAAWYGATAALANWPTALPGRAAGRGATATG